MPNLEITAQKIDLQEFKATVDSAWGLQPVHILFTLTDAAGNGRQKALWADVVVRSLVATGGYNNPAYNVNIGSTAHYEGGNIHDNNGITCPKNGPSETAFDKTIRIYPGDSVTYQVANPAGTFSYDILVYSYYADDHDLEQVRAALAEGAVAEI